RVLDATTGQRAGGHGTVRRPGRTNQAVGDGFIDLAAGQHLARDLVGVLALIQDAQRGTLPWQRAGNAVVAVDPPDLLDDVFGDRAVEAEIGWRDAQHAIGPCHRKMQVLKDARGLWRLDGDPEHALDAPSAHLDPRLLERPGIDIG